METIRDLFSLLKQMIYKVIIEPFKPWGFFGSNVYFPLKMFLRRKGVGNDYYKKLIVLKNKHKGERCFIIATGPSLTIEDLQMIRNEITVGENSIFKIYDKLGWVPTYYVMADPDLTRSIISNNDVDFNCFAKEYCIFNSVNRKEINCDNALFIDMNWLDHVYRYGKSKKFKFNEDIRYGLYDCYSVTQLCILIAIYMGFSDIYLLGADNNYLGDKQHFVSYNGEEKADRRTALLMQRANDMGYRYVRKVAEQHGVRLFNATRGGNIKCLKRVSLEKII